MKRIYIFISIIVLFLLGALIFLRINAKQEPTKTVTAKTILPTMKNQLKKTEESTDGSLVENESTIKVEIPLTADESLIDVYSTELNADGAEDQIIAIKKISDPSVYIIIALQDPIFKKFTKTQIIKTEITQPKSLSVNTLDFGFEEIPAIVCSGMTSDNKQLLTVFLGKNDDEKGINFVQSAVLRADIQINTVPNNKESNNLTMYDIHSFDIDPLAPNTLNQVEKIYSWDLANERYVKVSERIIPGEKVESQILKKLGSGNINLFKEFLHGLWIQPDSDANNNRSLYFDNKNNEIILFLNNTHESYTIKTASQRRYGLYMQTVNKAIPTIKFSVNIELKGVDEISIKVTENVARLKITATSTWDGVYRKKNDSIKNNITETGSSKLKNIKAIISKKNTAWKDEKHYLQMNETAFNFKTPFGIKKGLYSLSELNDNIILQFRDSNGDSFYVIQENTISKQKVITLNEVKIKLNQIEYINDEPITLYEVEVKEN